MLVFAMLAILLIIFVLLFRHKSRAGYARVIQKCEIIEVIFAESKNNVYNFVTSCLRRKHRRTRIKIGAVF